MIISVQITQCRPLENIFHCEVFDGEKYYSVVSAARNTKKNLLTFLALPGTELKNTTLTVKTILGQESFGMLCSCKDLGLSEENGLIDLPPSTSLGKNLSTFDSKELSSTPWYQFQLVDEFYLKNGLLNKKEGVLLSQTYFYEDSYYYRLRG